MRETFLLRIVVFDADWVERLSDAAVIDRIVAVDPSLQYRAKWLHEIALAWPQERQKKKEDATICQVHACGFMPDWHETDVVRV
jgi:transposase